MRLSFRKGGVQEAYRRLKNVLSDKVWERERSVSLVLTLDDAVECSFQPQLSSTTQNHSRADSGSLASPSTSRAVAGIGTCCTAPLMNATELLAFQTGSCSPSISKANHRMGTCKMPSRILKS